MKAIRGGSGLGDGIYLQSIARHLLGKGEHLEICSDYPDVFRQLGAGVTLSPFRRDRVAIVAHYTTRRAVQATTQFQDCCISAGLGAETVPLRLDWAAETKMAHFLRGLVRPIIVVPLPRAPFGRSDGYGLDLLPEWAAVQRAISRLAKRAFIVQVGAGKPLHSFEGIDLNLAGQTTVTELLDAVAVADAVLGWCSFMVPLAESLDKPGLFIWSSRGLVSADPVILNLTPRKILDKASSRYVIDEQPETEIERAADALFEQVRVPALV